jgi:hypothetical protein
MNGGPPQNAAFMVAAYIATAVILVTYAVVLIRRTRGGGL